MNTDTTKTSHDDTDLTIFGMRTVELDRWVKENTPQPGGATILCVQHLTQAQEFISRHQFVQAQQLINRVKYILALQSLRDVTPDLSGCESA